LGGWRPEDSGGGVAGQTGDTVEVGTAARSLDAPLRLIEVLDQLFVGEELMSRRFRW